MKAVLLLILFVSIQVDAQRAPVRLGKIDIEDLEMDVYEGDTSAPAVVLCDFYSFSGERITRIKILKESGKEWANFKIMGSSPSLIRGFTYNLKDGKIEKTKLTNDMIYSEKIYRTLEMQRVSMPDVRVGSVVEVKQSKASIPNRWFFQWEIPVVWSEFRMPQSEILTIEKSKTGYFPMVINEENRWAAENVPAFEPEPFINDPINYRGQFEMEVTAVHILGGSYNTALYEGIATSWDKVNENMMNAEHFGGALSFAPKFAKDAADEIMASDSTPMDRIIKAFSWIQEHIKWNGIKAKYVTNVLSEACDEQIGNAADVNLSLYHILNKMDFTVYPVMISTRDHGRIMGDSPTIDKFNYVILLVKLGEQNIFLDATEPLIPAGLLPARCLNGRGRIVSRKYHDWVPVETGQKECHMTSYKLQMDKSGILEGELTVKHTDYGAFKTRNSMEEFSGIEEYVIAFEKNKPGMSIQDYEIENKDNLYEPLIEHYQVNLKNQVEHIGDQLFCQPLFYESIDENPFRADVRRYPVHFENPFERSCMVTLDIPDDFKIDKIPEPLIMATPEKNAEFIYSVTPVGNTLQIMGSLKINRSAFTTEEYFILKNFYAQLVKKMSEPIVINTIGNEVSEK